MSKSRGGAWAVVLGAALGFGPAGAGQAQPAGPPAVVPSGGHTATALPDGSVLVIDEGNAAVFHPRDASWTAVAAPAVARLGHAATLLPDGRVLVAGGYPESTATSAVETFDPASSRWTSVQPMTVARFDHTLTALDDGTFLAAGGRAAGHGPFLPDAERYDPATDSWSPTGAMPLGRAFHTATKLKDGRVLVTGGQGTPHDKSLRDAVVFDPATNQWTPVHQLMSVGRARHTATLLPDGTVLIVGGTRQREGQENSDLEASAEVYDPQTDSLTLTGSLRVGRAGQAVVSVPDRGVLVLTGEQSTGGAEPGEADASAELYEPATRQWRQFPSPGKGAVTTTGTLLAGDCGRHCGEILLVGAFGARLYSMTAGSPDSASAAGGRSRLLLLLVFAALVLLGLAGGVLAMRKRSPNTD